MGVRMAIDDFGTGYASLAHLRHLPLDVIKIDPSFVAGLGHEDTLTLLTRTVVQLGRELGLRVIAEGIEQAGQLAMLRGMGCDYGQGFLVARPMAAPSVEALIRTSAREPAATAGAVPLEPVAVPPVPVETAAIQEVQAEIETLPVETLPVETLPVETLPVGTLAVGGAAEPGEPARLGM
jgi:hypothetical protein